MIRSILAVLFIAALAGCASGEKLVNRDTAPQDSVGYVGGNFTLQRPTFAAAFVLVHAESGQEYILPFTRQSNFEAGHTETSLVALPKGTYRATHWIVYNAYWGPGPASREFIAPLRPSKFTEPLTIRGGEVIFLGKFVTENQWTPGYTTSKTSGRWEAQRLSQSDAKRLLSEAYPKFSGQPFVCVTC